MGFLFQPGGDDVKHESAEHNIPNILFFFQPHRVGVKHESALHNNPIFLLIGLVPNEVRYNNPMHYVYILQSLKKPDWLYKGSTSDLRKRFKEHNTGKNFSTSPYRPLRLIYYEAYLLKEDAEARERYLKSSMGMKVIKKQLNNYLKILTKNRF